MTKRTIESGLSLVEIIVGIALLSLVFLGIYGAFFAVLKASGQSVSQASAIALANQKMEQVRNMPYQEIGTDGGIPSGFIPQTENINKNKVDFEVKTTVVYIDDSFDGLSPVDIFSADYKRIKISVSWKGWAGGEFFLVSDASPKRREDEAAGGTLKISVIDAFGAPVPQADVNVVNTLVSPNIDADYKSDNEGLLVLAGAPTSTNGYEITVSKTGFSEDRTYSFLEVSNPAKSHASVLEAQTTDISFAIDKLSSFLVYTKSRDGFDDYFNSSENVASSTNILVDAGEIKLQQESGLYKSIGTIESDPVLPSILLNWDRLYFNDYQTADAVIRYQILFATGSSFILIPETDLPGNEAGFISSPINLSSLDTSEFSSLKIRAILSTSDDSTTPRILDWHLVYNTDLIGSVNFHLRGSKVIGTGSSMENVYKYTETLQSGADGSIAVSNLEWDAYYFAATSTTGMALTETVPAESPVGLVPDTSSKIVTLYFQSQNQLLVKVIDSSSSLPIFGANIKITNLSLGYEANELTNANGEAFFVPLSNAQYDIEASFASYEILNTTVLVSGATLKNISLTLQN